MDDSAAIMGKYEKYKQQPESHGRHNEEISGDHIAHMVFQKRLPSLR
jgi:hypothetical protein